MRIMDGLIRQLTYFPDTTRVRPAALWFPGGRDVELRTEDGLALTAWFIPPLGDEHPDRHTALLYAPGNGGHRESRGGLIAEFAFRGFSSLLIDYRGYGGNPGTPSEAGLAADARAAADFLVSEGWAPERTIYVGESLGTGVVTRLASTHRPAGLVLRSPYTSLYDVAKVHYGWLPIDALMKDRYELLDYLRESDVPVTVIHGRADDIVPSRLSAEVAANAGNLFEELALPGSGHNDEIMYGPVVADAVVRLADAVVR